MPRHLISNVLGLIGAVVGGVVGYYIFRWLLNHGYYGLIIPGAFVGLGCSLLARHPSIPRGVICGIAALALSLFADWNVTITDDSFLDFIRNGKVFQPVTLLMTGIATFIAFWIGKDATYRAYRERPVPPPKPSD
jgi:hypothetical protein